ncbi:hypothetical protein GZH46_02207, partial [Fragariocoptes setiger]
LNPALTMTPTRISSVLLWLVLGQVLIMALVMPHAGSQVEAKKEKKLAKALISGLIVKNLSTKKNIVAMPVPIPGKLPKLSNIGEITGSLLMQRKAANSPSKASTAANTSIFLRILNLFSFFRQQTKYSKVYETINQKQLHQYKKSHHRLTSALVNNIIKVVSTKNTLNHRAQNFHFPLDIFDASTPVYVMGKPKIVPIYKPTPVKPIIYYKIKASIRPYNGKHQTLVQHYSHHNDIRRHDDQQVRQQLQQQQQQQDVSRLERAQEYHQADHDRQQANRRSGYSYTSGNYETPCVGFPLEINIRSRIIPDQLFPIHGNSQMKKCIPLEPPRLNKPDIVRIRLNYKGTPRPTKYYRRDYQQSHRSRLQYGASSRQPTQTGNYNGQKMALPTYDD